MVPWARVMASLHWAALCYCRITERLIETNDSNNGTLSPQAGFVVGLISVAVAARRTSHHTDPSKEAAEAPFLVGSTGFSYEECVRVPTFFKASVINVNMSRHPRVPLRVSPARLTAVLRLLPYSCSSPLTLSVNQLFAHTHQKIRTKAHHQNYKFIWLLLSEQQLKTKKYSVHNHIKQRQVLSC